MTPEQEGHSIGRIVVADQMLKVGEPVLLWLPNTRHFFEGYVTFRDGDVAHVWVGPFMEKLRRPDGPLDPDDPHTQIAFWNDGAWDTDLEKSPGDDRYLIAMDFNDLRAVLCGLEVPEQDEESLRERLGCRCRTTTMADTISDRSKAVRPAHSIATPIAPRRNAVHHARASPMSACLAGAHVGTGSGADRARRRCRCGIKFFG